MSSFVIPKSHHSAVRQFYDDVSALTKESNLLTERYCRELEELQERYIKPSSDIRMRMDALRRKGSEEMCAACGIAYDPEQSYAVDTSYMDDIGVAYLQVLDSAPATVASAERAPAGTRLN